MNIETRFVLLFEGRTGSSLLGGLLNQNPAISCLGEEVARLRHSGWSAQEQWMTQLYFDPNHVDDRRLKPDSRAVGFKVKVREIASPDRFRTFIESNDLKVIHMHRENFIKQVVSSIRAIDLYRSTGRYNLTKHEIDLIPHAYPIPRRRFHKTLLWLQDAVNTLDAFVASLSVPVHYLTYEALCDDMNNTLLKVTEFLDVEFNQAHTRLIKITDDDLRNVVTNYEELRQLYAYSEFSSMF